MYQGEGPLDRNVLSLDAFRRKKTLDEVQHVPKAHYQSHLQDAETEEALQSSNSSKQVLERMERIRTTIRKINQVMDELKQMSKKDYS